MLIAASGAVALADKPDKRPPKATSRHDIVFYCDGAGGGGPLTHWHRNVRKGLQQAGFRGDFENVHWQTGLGPVADQAASVDHKREEARELADSIHAHLRKYPGAKVDLIGLSAGSAVATYALEQLPRGDRVHSVVMLGSSLSADYDLRSALRRVNGNVYVLTSKDDPVLKFIVPLTGTADRRHGGTKIAGRDGARLPEDADSETRALYAKVKNVSFQPSSKLDRNSHTATTHPEFVRTVIAPLLGYGAPPADRVAKRS